MSDYPFGTAPSREDRWTYAVDRFMKIIVGVTDTVVELERTGQHRMVLAHISQAGWVDIFIIAAGYRPEDDSLRHVALTGSQMDTLIAAVQTKRVTRCLECEKHPTLPGTNLCGVCTIRQEMRRNDQDASFAEAVNTIRGGMTPEMVAEWKAQLEIDHMMGRDGQPMFEILTPEQIIADSDLRAANV
jgi:hypothetical protein